MPSTLAAIAEACSDGSILGVCREVFFRELSLPRAFVHLSAVAGISGMLSPNIVVLRMLSVLSSSSAMAFNLWNNLMSPVVWNVAFITVNLRHIAKLMLANKETISLDPNEQRLYELGFAQFGVSLRDYAKLLLETKSSWREYAANEVIVRQGDPMPRIWYVVDGEVEVVKRLGDGEEERTVAVLTPGKGGWLGELWDPNQEADYWDRAHHWLAGFRAKRPSLLVAFDDRHRLHEAS